MILALFLACKPETANPKPQDSAAETADTGETAEPPHEGPLHPELDGYPRIVALPEDRDTILARVAGTTGDDDSVERWQALYANIQSSCDSTPPVPEADPISPGQTWAAMAVARDCAFLAWLDGDAEAAAKAEATLLTLPPDAGTLSDDTTEVHLSTALALAVEAWDLLAGADSGLDLDPSRAAVLSYARSFWARYTEEVPFYFQLWQNNHNLKFAAAFGMAGLVFNTEDEAWTWASYAQTELPWLYGNLQAADGGYGEGPYYQMYGAMQTLPYVRAWHRLLGDTGERFDVLCATRPNDTCEEGTREAVGDLWDSEVIHDGLLWNARVRMPDGTRPPVDDGVPVGFPSAMMAELDPVLGWDWKNQADPFVTWAGTNAAELLSGWDGSATEPDWSLCETLPDSGEALLRGGWGSEDTWVMLLAEPYGPMVNSGHEHADAGTIQVYARGQYLVIDAGYPSYEDRELTEDYSHHSGVLVDGEGPPLGSADNLDVAWADKEGCQASVSLAWSDVSWTRGVWLDGDVIVIRDQVAKEDAESYQLRLQTLSGEDRGTLELVAGGAVLRRDGVSLSIAVASPEGAALSSEEDTDALTYGTTETHDALTATIENQDRTTFLTVLVIGDEDDEPTIRADEGGLVVNGVPYDWED